MHAFWSEPTWTSCQISFFCLFFKPRNQLVARFSVHLEPPHVCFCVFLLSRKSCSGREWLFFFFLSSFSIYHNLVPTFYLQLIYSLNPILFTSSHQNSFSGSVQSPQIWCWFFSSPYCFPAAGVVPEDFAWSAVHSFTHLLIPSADVLLECIINQLLWTLGQGEHRGEQELLVRQLSILSKLIATFSPLLLTSFFVEWGKQLINTLHR